MRMLDCDNSMPIIRHLVAERCIARYNRHAVFIDQVQEDL